jgi:hypothetical protein
MLSQPDRYSAFPDHHLHFEPYRVPEFSHQNWRPVYLFNELYCSKKSINAGFRKNEPFPL